MHAYQAVDSWEGGGSQSKENYFFKRISEIYTLKHAINRIAHRILYTKTPFKVALLRCY